MVATMLAESDCRVPTQDVIGSVESFTKLGLSECFRRALLLAGYRKPSPVQETAIPLTRLGSDLIVQAKSGTGKTLVFALACIERVHATAWHPQALVISPTREIAQQNATEIQKIANNLPYPNLTCTVITGGVSLNEDRRRLLRPCQVIVGTPGRLQCLVQKNLLNLDGLRLLVLDEADQLFSNQTLYADVQSLVNSLPAARQSLAFSATYNAKSVAALEAHMDYPQHVIIKESQKPLLGVKQCFKIISNFMGQSSGHDVAADDDSDDKDNFYRTHNRSKTLGQAVDDDDEEEEEIIFSYKIDSLLEILKKISFHQAVVFCNSGSRAEILSRTLTDHGFPAAFTSGHKSQDHRIQTLNAMRDFELRVVISTDLYARGVDLERINLVIHLDLPFDKETYQHRVGRTGRFGTYGISVSLITFQEKQKLEEYCSFSSHSDDIIKDTNHNHSVLIPLPEEIPLDWYERKLKKGEDRVAYQKLLETPFVSEPLRHFESEKQDWIGKISQSEFKIWRKRIEKKNLFWKDWDPYDTTTSSKSPPPPAQPPSHAITATDALVTAVVESQTSMKIIRDISATPSETSSRSVLSSRKSNCIRLPMRLSRTTSASSVVYSEEGDCEFTDDDNDDDDDLEVGEEEYSSQEKEIQVEIEDSDCKGDQSDVEILEQLKPPSFPPEIHSLSDFHKMKGNYEKWREDYMKWHKAYSQWVDDFKQSNKQRIAKTDKSA